MHVNPYPVRVCPDGINIAIRNRYRYIDVDTDDPTALNWRSSDGSIYSDRQVESWTLMAPRPEVPATGDAADVVGRVIDDAARSRDIDPEQAGPIRDAIVQDLRLAGLIDTDVRPASENAHASPVGTAAVAMYDAWKKAYPPHIGSDLDASAIPPMLTELSIQELEILALALGDLKAFAWEVRSEKITAEVRRERGIVTARVDVDSKGRLDGLSTVTIDGAAAPVPPRVESTGVLAPPRIAAAVQSLGYRVVKGMQATGALADDGSGRGWLEYNVIREETTGDE